VPSAPRARAPTETGFPGVSWDEALDDIAPGVVMAPMGAWRKNARGSSTVNAVNPFVFADLGNAPTFSDTRVEIEPAQAGDC
jgi:anaerobic selenocysteine-containing dehydrogenase